MYYRYKNLDDLKKIKTPYGMFEKLNVFLIRHGETVQSELKRKYEEDGKILDEEDVIEDAKLELSETGKNQSETFGKNMVKYMKLNGIDKNKTLVLISPFERTRQTYEIANTFLKFDDNSEKVFVLNVLAEQSYGAFHMIDKTIKKQKYEKEYNLCKRNTISFFKPQFLGESPFDVSIRNYFVFEFIKEIMSKNEIENVFVFGHRNCNRSLMMDILNLPPEFYDDFDDGKNLSVINIKNGKYIEFEMKQ